MRNLQQLVKDNTELKEFFEEIAQWILDNDYECGMYGSEIYDKIAESPKDSQ
jgi:hypothetical protein